MRLIYLEVVWVLLVVMSGMIVLAVNGVFGVDTCNAGGSCTWSLYGVMWFVLDTDASGMRGYKCACGSRFLGSSTVSS